MHFCCSHWRNVQALGGDAALITVGGWRCDPKHDVALAGKFCIGSGRFTLGGQRFMASPKKEERKKKGFQADTPSQAHDKCATQQQQQHRDLPDPWA
jgi:hypothetical protein